MDGLLGRELGRALGPAWCAPKKGTDLGDDMLRCDVSYQHKGHRSRWIVLAIIVAQAALAERGDRLFAAQKNHPIGVTTVQRLCKQPKRNMREIVLLRMQLIEDLLLLLFDFVLSKLGVQDAIGEDLERDIE